MLMFYEHIVVKLSTRQKPSTSAYKHINSAHKLYILLEPNPITKKCLTPKIDQFKHSKATSKDTLYKYIHFYNFNYISLSLFDYV